MTFVKWMYRSFLCFKQCSIDVNFFILVHVFIQIFHAINFVVVDLLVLVVVVVVVGFWAFPAVSATSSSRTEAIPSSRKPWRSSNASIQTPLGREPPKNPVGFWMWTCGACFLIGNITYRTSPYFNIRILIGKSTNEQNLSLFIWWFGLCSQYLSTINL